MEVDCSGYGAASVVRASLRHVIEDVMDGNITTGKLTVLLVPECQWPKLTSTVKLIRSPENRVIPESLLAFLDPVSTGLYTKVNI